MIILTIFRFYIARLMILYRKLRRCFLTKPNKFHIKGSEIDHAKAKMVLKVLYIKQLGLPPPHKSDFWQPPIYLNFTASSRYGCIADDTKNRVIMDYKA